MKKLFVSTIVTAGLALFAAAPAMAATPASFSLSPSNGTKTVGSTLSVGIYENGDNVNAVTVKLSYDATKLSCAGIGGSGAFPSEISASCGGGSVTISRYVAPGNPAVNGSQLVGTLNFAVVNPAASSSLSFAAGSQIASNGTNTWDGGSFGGSYVFVAAPVTPPSTTNPGRGGDSTPGTTAPSGQSTNGTPAQGTTSTSSSNAATAAEEGTTVITNADGTKTVIKVAASKQASSETTTPALQTARFGAVVLTILLALGAGIYYLAKQGYLPSFSAWANKLKTASQPMFTTVRHKLNKI